MRGITILPMLLAGDPFFRLSDVQFEDVQGGQLPSDAFVTRLRGLVGGDALPVLTRDGQRRVDTLSGHALAVNAVDWSPDGRRIVSASNDNALRIWDAST